MNILLIDRFFLPNIGGAEFVFTLIGEALARSGHKVWVITNKYENYESPKKENIHIKYISSPQIITENKHWELKDKIRFTLNAVKAGISIIRKENIQIIHSNPTYPAIVGSILSFLTSTPHCIIIHGVRPLKSGALQEILKKNEKSKINSSAISFLTKFIFYLKSSAIHTVSEATKDDLLKLGVKKPIYIIPNAIQVKEAEKIETNPFQLVHVSRLIEYKNIQTAIKAINIVKRTFQKVILFIVGEGPYRKNLEELVSKLDLKDNIIFKGHVSDEVKTKLIASSQALLFPSINEGFGMVILEAFTQKKPVLVSNLRPMSDIVKDKKTGLVIHPFDEQEWANSIEEIFKDPKKTENMGHAGRNLLEERHNLEKYAQQIIAMYKKIIKNKD